MEIDLVLHQFDVFGKQKSDETASFTLHGNNTKEQTFRIPSNLLPLFPTIDVPSSLTNIDWHIILPDIDRESFHTLFALLNEGKRRNFCKTSVTLANLQTRLLSLGWLFQEDGEVIPYKFLDKDAYEEFIKGPGYKLLRESTGRIQYYFSGKDCVCKKNQLSAESYISVSPNFTHTTVTTNINSKCAQRSLSPLIGVNISPSDYTDKSNGSVKELNINQPPPSEIGHRSIIDDKKEVENFGASISAGNSDSKDQSEYSQLSNDRNIDELERDFVNDAKILLETDKLVGNDINLNHNNINGSVDDFEEQSQPQNVQATPTFTNRLEQEMIVSPEIQDRSEGQDESIHFDNPIEEGLFVMDEGSHGSPDFLMGDADEMLTKDRFEISSEIENDHKEENEPLFASLQDTHNPTGQDLTPEFTSLNANDNTPSKPYKLRERKNRSLNEAESMSSCNINLFQPDKSSSIHNIDKVGGSDKIRQPPKPVGDPDETDPLLTGFEVKSENSIESWPLNVQIPEKINQETASRLIVGIKRGQLYYLTMTAIRQIITTSPTFGSGHTKEGTKICIFCGSSGLKLQNLYNHIQMHHSNFKTTCGLCDQVVISENRLLSHLNMRHPKATNEIAKNRAQCRFKLFRTDDNAFEAGKKLISSGQVNIGNRTENVACQPRNLRSRISPMEKPPTNIHAEKSAMSAPLNGHSKRKVITVPNSNSDNQSTIPKLRIVTQSDKMPILGNQLMPRQRSSEPISSSTLEKREPTIKVSTSNNLPTLHNMGSNRPTKIQKVDSRGSFQINESTSQGNQDTEMTTLKVCYECGKQSDGGFCNSTRRFFCFKHHPYSKNSSTSRPPNHDNRASSSPIVVPRQIQTFNEKVALLRNNQRGINSNYIRSSEANVSSSNSPASLSNAGIRQRKKRTIFSPAQVKNMRQSSLSPVGLHGEQSPTLSGRILSSEESVEPWPFNLRIPETIDDSTKARILVGMKRGLLYSATMLQLAQIFTSAPAYSMNGKEHLICILCGSARYLGTELHHHIQRIHTSYSCECPNCKETFLTEPSFVAHILSHPKCPHPNYASIRALGNVLSGLKMELSDRQAKQVGNTLVAQKLVNNVVSPNINVPTSAIHPSRS